LILRGFVKSSTQISLFFQARSLLKLCFL
jgi:hypothetical protein